jgi:diphthine synthase
MARIGSDSQRIAAGTIEKVASVDFGAPLHSLVVAGDIHDCEMEHLRLFML